MMRKRSRRSHASPPKQPGLVAAHAEPEDKPWTIWLASHIRRENSKDYRRSRTTMKRLVASQKGFFYGRQPYEDHHGGGLWLKDGQGWFLVRNLAGMEWVSQFCADPKLVDLLRQNARRVYAAFPEAVHELGIRELLDTPITDADGIAAWTDSICNASVPLPSPVHTGSLPKSAGIHHYPSPVAEIALFKERDFPLWVTDKNGGQQVIVPVKKRGSGDGRVRVLLAEHQGALTRKRLRPPVGKVLPRSHPIAKAAFAEQYEKIESGNVPSTDPLSRLV